MSGMTAREHLVIGNTAERKKMQDGKQRFMWTFYVRGATKRVQSVTVKLHPTFKDPIRELQGPKFELKCSGWGTFDLDVTVEWKGGSSTEHVWELQFDKADASKEVDVPPEVIGPDGACSLPAIAPAAAAAAAAPPPKPKAKPKAKQVATAKAKPAFGAARVPPPRGPGAPEKLFKAEEVPEDKLVGVVVTISEGESYDKMFRNVRPSTGPGERISTYAMTCRDVAQLHVYLEGTVPVPESQPTWRSLVHDVGQVEADSVTFNWECCSSCGDSRFPCPRGQGPCGGPLLAEPETEPGHEGSPGRAEQAASPTMRFMAFALRAGFTVMCSDFSLKSVLHEWSAELLGPNPFVRLGTCNQRFQLEFVPAELQHEDVPQQLQVVGQLCSEEGKAVVKAMGGTILYSVDPNRPETELYSLKVLTVATDCGCASFLRGAPQGEAAKCGVGRAIRGYAGHVALTYASGGQLITSMGHWSELSQIGTSIGSVLRVAGQEFGDEETAAMQMEYASMQTDAERAACVQKCAKYMVEKSAPSKMKGKKKAK